MRKKPFSKPYEATIIKMLDFTADMRQPPRIDAIFLTTIDAKTPS
jgi:hypothetical protein